jgi:glycerol-3-phosphate dehydrogenase
MAVQPYDMVIVGGGVNGTAIARAAAVAGKTVILVEKDDLAQATSSASTKLMHGGLRYLEYYEFKLVHEALKERAVMLRAAPHLVYPLEFRLPHDPKVRPWWMVRAGLLLYDMFALGGGLPRSRPVKLDDPNLRTSARNGFSYYDGWVDDSRLVVLNARDAADLGAEIATHTRFVSAVREADVWHVKLADDQHEWVVTARMFINAAGPWVDRVLREGLGINNAGQSRLVRGSHIIVRRCLSGDHAWLLQQPDGRVVFAIPYLDDFTLIGTTDVPVDKAEDAHISDAERDYLIAAANLYLQTQLTRADIVGDYSGIRPLFDDGEGDAKAVSRDYHLEMNTSGATLLSVFGGKITTARHLAEVALSKLGIAGGDTRKRPIPGGDMANFSNFLVQVKSRWPFLGDERALRMARAYGTRIDRISGDATSNDDLGIDFGAGLTQREVDYLVSAEWARSTDDILWRRSKLGMQFTPEQVDRLAAYLNAGR